MIYILFSLLLTNVLAEVPKVDTIPAENAEETKTLTIYVDKPEVVNLASDKISSDINQKTIVGYVSQYVKNSKAKSGYSTWSPVTQVYDKIRVYDRETIEFFDDECNYKREALQCGVKNNHYTVKTYINITEHEITTKMILYSPEALIINQATATSREIVRWIKQQEVTIVQQQSMMGNSTTIHIPKEELPLKWQIPPKIWDRHFYKMSLGLFTAVKID